MHRQYSETRDVGAVELAMHRSEHAPIYHNIVPLEGLSFACEQTVLTSVANPSIMHGPDAQSKKVMLLS